MDGASIRQVDAKEDLAQLNALWRANSQILGMFPLDAFKEFADKGFIIGAYKEKQLVGYLLFRPNRSGVIRITHLCTREEHRGQGLARSLVEELIKRFPTAKRLALNCRKDFDVAKLRMEGHARIGWRARIDSYGHILFGHRTAS